MNLPAGSVAGGNQSQNGNGDASSPDSAASEPAAETRSADAKAADSTGDAATGTTIKIAVYRSSYPVIWDLNDKGAPDETKAVWAGSDKHSAPDWWPKEASPGSKVDYDKASYVPWQSDDAPGSEPHRPGFNFMGWSTKPSIAVEGTGKLDALSIPKDTQPAEGEDGAKSITLYALWAPINYSVVFDLTKNPEDASAAPAFDWVPAKGTLEPVRGTFEPGGRWRLSGVTLEDYDPSTGLIEIGTPQRGTGGYRFLSWAEPDSQQDPAVAVKKPGTSKWYVNPVALPHYDYEPVLTARWSLSFDVDVPSQVTFDEYDLLEVEGNLTDTTDEDAIDEESPDAHDAGKRAHFCSQSTATDYKIVALKSKRQPTASKILTTSDSAKATQEEVLGQEKLLSLFAEGATAESQGVHFKLDDDVDMDDSTRYGSFVIPKQEAPFDPSATERDDESRLYVSYRLNLSNKVGDSETPNHGLVTPGSVNEGDRTPIAAVSYEFAVADDEVRQSFPYDPLCFWTEDDDGSVMDIDAIAAEAKKVAAGDSAAVSKYTAWMNADHRFYVKWYDQGVLEPEGGLLKNAYSTYEVRIIGINHDTVPSSYGGGKAGLTFQFVDLLKDKYRMNATATNAGGWRDSELRARMNNGNQSPPYGTDDNAIWNQIPLPLQNSAKVVAKTSLSNATTGATAPTWERVFIAGYSELATINYPPSEILEGSVSQEGPTYAYYKRFNTDGSSGAGQDHNNPSLVKRRLGSADYWWERTLAITNRSDFFWTVNGEGRPMFNSGVANTTDRGGVAPCFCL